MLKFTARIYKHKKFLESTTELKFYYNFQLVSRGKRIIATSKSYTTKAASIDAVNTYFPGVEIEDMTKLKRRF